MIFDNVWVEKYRPTTTGDVILPARIKAVLMDMVNNNTIHNCVFTSESAGTGKTTAAKALCADVDASTLYINASLHNSIDDVRTKVMNFASTMSIDGRLKVVILDEADRLSSAAQDAMKGVIEQVHKSCRFIFTANNRDGLIEPLLSRCTVDIDFNFAPDERNEVNAGILKVCLDILKDNNIEHDPRAVAAIVKQTQPDNRKIIQTLQEIAAAGEGITLANINDAATGGVDKIVGLMLSADFLGLKEYTTGHCHRFNAGFYGKLYKVMYPKLTENRNKADLIHILNDFQRVHTTVPDKFIHFLAMFTAIMETVL